jgi:hypothetical protein
VTQRLSGLQNIPTKLSQGTRIRANLGLIAGIPLGFTIASLRRSFLPRRNCLASGKKGWSLAAKRLWSEMELRKQKVFYGA